MTATQLFRLPKHAAAFLAAAIVLWSSAPPSSAADVKSLAPVYRQFLEDVQLLITKEEKKAFLALEKDYQRDAFIRDFWKSRDLYPETERNEFESDWKARLEEVKRRFPSALDDRGRIFQLWGEPVFDFTTDCGVLFLPINVWRFRTGKDGIGSLTFLFVQPAASGPFRLWRPRDGWDALLPGLRNNELNPVDEYRFREILYNACGGDGPI